MLVHDGFIRAIARGLLAEPSPVDDVVQQTWLRALCTPPAASGSLRGWLAAVTRNNALTALRRVRRRERHERAAAVVPRVPSAARIVEQEAVRREVVEAVLKLEEHYQSIVL